MIASCAEVSCFHTIAKLFRLQAPSQGHHFSIVAPHPHGKFLCSFMYISMFGLGVFFVVVIGFWFGFGGFFSLQNSLLPLVVMERFRTWHWPELGFSKLFICFASTLPDVPLISTFFLSFQAKYLSALSSVEDVNHIQTRHIFSNLLF